MSKISRKIIASVICMLLTLTVVIIATALVMAGRQTDELMTEHAVIGIHLLENSISVEEERLGRAADDINQGASAAALSGNTRTLENAWEAVRKPNTISLSSPIRKEMSSGSPKAVM